MPGSDSERGARVLRFSDQRAVVVECGIAGLLFGRMDRPVTVTPIPDVKVLTLLARFWNAVTVQSLAAGAIGGLVPARISAASIRCTLHSSVRSKAGPVA